MKNVVLLGASGSIGISTLNVLRQNKELFTLKAIAINQNLDIALEIIQEFHPEHVFIFSKNINTDHAIFSSSSNIFTDQEETLQHVALRFDSRPRSSCKSKS